MVLGHGLGRGARRHHGDDFSRHIAEGLRSVPAGGVGDLDPHGHGLPRVVYGKNAGTRGHCRQQPVLRHRCHFWFGERVGGPRGRRREVLDSAVRVPSRHDELQGRTGPLEQDQVRLDRERLQGARRWGIPGPAPAAATGQSQGEGHEEQDGWTHNGRTGAGRGGHGKVLLRIGQRAWSQRVPNGNGKGRRAGWRSRERGAMAQGRGAGRFGLWLARAGEWAASPGSGARRKGIVSSFEQEGREGGAAGGLVQRGRAVRGYRFGGTRCPAEPVSRGDPNRMPVAGEAFGPGRCPAVTSGTGSAVPGQAAQIIVPNNRRISK